MNKTLRAEYAARTQQQVTSLWVNRVRRFTGNAQRIAAFQLFEELTAKQYEELKGVGAAEHKAAYELAGRLPGVPQFAKLFG